MSSIPPFEIFSRPCHSTSSPAHPPSGALQHPSYVLHRIGVLVRVLFEPPKKASSLPTICSEHSLSQDMKDG
ncbi:hypothetical protein I3843_03G183700 [Carya illinoinensis]|nr:hypothetical protein I3843_03G183700 [Carya illinoinensis]